MLDEVVHLEGLVNYLRKICSHLRHEIIIVDGGSKDGSYELAQKIADLALITAAGRAHQLNVGASYGKGDYLYFLHADCRPPEQLGKWLEYLSAQKLTAGCFRLCFTPSTWLLRQFSYCTRYDVDAFRYGDQSLLVLSTSFTAVSGYNEQLPLMEGNDIVRRLKRAGSFRVLPDQILTSSRKYQRHGVFYLQAVYVGIYLLNRLGASTAVQLGFYNRCLGK